MSEFLFKTFKQLHRALRGTGLGKVKALRDLRDLMYRASRPTTPRVVEVGGFKLWVDPSTAGGVVPWLLLDEVHEPSETKCIRENLPPGGTFVDVGANIGYYTVLAARAVGPSGRVYGFEPEPVNFETLRKNIALNGLGNVVLEPLACSDRAAEMQLFLDETNAGGHHIHDSRDGSKAATIRTVALDDYFSGPDHNISLLKMDIQGHEPVALRGMHDLLRRNPGAKIITEFDAPMIRTAGEAPEAYLEDLRSLGFRFTILSDYGEAVVNAEAAEIISRCRNGEFVNLFCYR
jgi:FkbM family methyltransferase